MRMSTFKFERRLIPPKTHTTREDGVLVPSDDAITTADERAAMERAVCRATQRTESMIESILMGQPRVD